MPPTAPSTILATSAARRSSGVRQAGARRDRREGRRPRPRSGRRARGQLSGDVSPVGRPPGGRLCGRWRRAGSARRAGRGRHRQKLSMAATRAASSGSKRRVSRRSSRCFCAFGAQGRSSSSIEARRGSRWRFGRVARDGGQRGLPLRRIGVGQGGTAPGRWRSGRARRRWASARSRRISQRAERFAGVDVGQGKAVAFGQGDDEKRRRPCGPRGFRSSHVPARSARAWIAAVAQRGDHRADRLARSFSIWRRGWPASVIWQRALRRILSGRHRGDSRATARAAGRRGPRNGIASCAPWAGGTGCGGRAAPAG